MAPISVPVKIELAEQVPAVILSSALQPAIVPLQVPSPLPDPSTISQSPCVHEEFALQAADYILVLPKIKVTKEKYKMYLR